MTLRDAGVTLIDCEHRTPPEAENGDDYRYVAIPQVKAEIAERIAADCGEILRDFRNHFCAMIATL